MNPSRYLWLAALALANGVVLGAALSDYKHEREHDTQCSARCMPSASFYDHDLCFCATTDDVGRWARGAYWLPVEDIEARQAARSWRGAP